jgi:ABC-type transport system substrate-binding protein
VPRPFEPRLAAVLAAVAWSAVLDPQGKKNIELTELPKLTLAHPSDSIARTACETIKLQLARAGITVELLEFTADDLLADAVDYDLRYAELAVWEPVVDARALVGPGGLAGDLGSSYLQAALRELDDAANWKDVRAKLTEIHDIAYHDLPLVPLWQTVNHFAYRTAVQGIGQSPVSLYQNVDQWRIAAGASTDTAEPTDQD